MSVKSTKQSGKQPGKQPGVSPGTRAGTPPGTQAGMPPGTQAGTPPPSVESALELLRSHLVELEAVAHAAEDALQYLPYVPRPPVTPGEESAPYTDKQLGLGRLQAMVAATSSASRILLQEIDRLLDDVQEPRPSKYGVDPRTGASRARDGWDLKLLFAPRPASSEAS